ncbi:hypothetical protein TRIATDRAFT_322171 [Trichoderma atroviride IMI 206040]|uniref:BTB domain-containing protein n=1 Tax=Hypocrea atroviridis (strain ATCC 20476 / IMI 206040) TaxID=452589 RepID=G9P4X0_HYPAI|nr:uncharacterized protein TRIATDRAFT_322171 [Trichoderma atroviride IMI 206040]EHK42052.1 hypothetical protein TRIATDRAFT_322171 [Trichoderma atroviride IMI 206040]
MQKQYFELDPHGDVLLTLRRPDHLDFARSARRAERDILVATPEVDSNVHESVQSGKPTASMDDPNASDNVKKVQFLLSSRHLSLASPVFDAMLSGCWKESTVLDERPRKIARRENRDTSDSELQVRHEISATEWNTEALLLLMNIIHGRHRKLPDDLHPETLAHFGILVDYYKCHEITEIFARRWIHKNKFYLPTTYSSFTTLWIFISWVFSDAAIFEEMTEQGIKESQGPVNAMFLPLPPAVSDAIEEKRASSLQRIIRHVDKIREALIKGEVHRSCGDGCSTMLLGTLIKAMHEHGISESQLLNSRPCPSLMQIKQTLLGFRTPTWYNPSDYRQRSAGHSCSVKSLLEPGIDGILKNLKGLKLNDYRVQQEDEVPKV